MYQQNKPVSNKPRNPYQGFGGRMTGVQNRYGGYTQGIYDKLMGSPMFSGAPGTGGGGSSSWAGIPSAGSPLLQGHKRAMRGDVGNAVRDTTRQLAPSMRASRGFAARGTNPYGDAVRGGLETVAGQAGQLHERAANLAHRDYGAGLNAWNSLAGLLGSTQSNELGSYSLGLQGRQADSARDLALRQADEGRRRYDQEWGMQSREREAALSQQEEMARQQQFGWQQAQGDRTRQQLWQDRMAQHQTAMSPWKGSNTGVSNEFMNRYPHMSALQTQRRYGNPYA